MINIDEDPNDSAWIAQMRKKKGIVKKFLSSIDKLIHIGEEESD